MRIAVTGSAGNVGRPTCRALVAAGHEVIGLDVGFAKELDGVDQRVVDLLDRGRVFDLLGAVDAVIHLGNHPHAYAAKPPVRVYTENAAMNAHVFEAALAQGCRRIVFVSSVQTLGSTRTLADDPLPPARVPYLPMDGDTPASPTNLYGLSKLAGEELLEMHTRLTPDLCGVAVRLPYIGGTPGVPMGRDLERARAHEHAKHHSVDEGFSYLPHDDVARLLLAVLDRMTPGFDRLFPAVDDNRFGLDAETLAREFFPGVPLRADLAGRRSVIDNAAITARYGWAPTPVELPEPVA